MPNAPWTSVISPENVKRQLISLQPALERLSQGDVDKLIQESIAASQAEFERETRIFLWPRIIKTFPLSTDVLGVDYDLQQDQFDFYQSGYRTVGFFESRFKPLQSLQRLSVEYGATHTLLTYPPDWIRIQTTTGHINVVPISALGAGPTYGLLQPEFWLPLLSGGWLNGVIPLIISIDYTCGISDIATNDQYADLKLALAKAASIYIRDAITEMVPMSVSVDGVALPYPSILQQTQVLRQEWEAFKIEYARQYSSVRLTFI